MSKIKAVVLERKGTKYTVLSQSGTFRQVYRRQDAEIGEEIEISSGMEISRNVRVWAGMAAVFLLVLSAFVGWNLYQAPTAVALLSVDINPSVQFTLDAQGQLISVQMQNGDAKRMLSKTDLHGKSLDSVLKQIINQAILQQFLTFEHHWIVVGYSPMTSNASVQMPSELNKDRITQWVTEQAEKQGFAPQVAVFDLAPQECALAQKENLTLGEYALLETAQKAGVVTQPEMLKDTSERVRVLENPKVQEQLKKEQNGQLDSGSTKQKTPSSPVKHPNSMLEGDKGQKPDDVTSKQKDSEKNQQKDSENSRQKDWENNQQRNQRNGQGNGPTKETEPTKGNVHRETEGQSSGDNEHDMSRSDQIYGEHEEK
jgi:hypothetical protein